MLEILLSFLLIITFMSSGLAQQLSYEVVPTRNSLSRNNLEASALVFNKLQSKVWSCRVQEIFSARRGSPNNIAGDCRSMPENPFSLNANFQIKRANNPTMNDNIIPRFYPAIFWFVDQTEGTVEFCNFGVGNPQCFLLPHLP